MAVDELRVPMLLEAMQENVRDTLTRLGSRLIGGEVGNGSIGQATYRNRYEEANATGVIRIGPAYRDQSRPGASSAFVIPVWIEEQWVAN